MRLGKQTLVNDLRTELMAKKSSGRLVEYGHGKED